jgi:hypothetical protein
MGIINSRLSRAVDGAVLWRLGLISVAPSSGDGDGLLDPQAFWSASRVATPAPLSAKLVRTSPPWARLVARNERPTFIDLFGPSQGPGDHWGATSLRARLALNPRPDAPFVLLLHGYAVPAPWYEERQMQLLARRGFSVGRLDMPFHLSRRVPRHAPGSGFFSSDPARTLAVLSQAVEDAAAVMAWVRDELGARIGVHGVSLGGLVGGLLAATVPLDSAMLITPPCDLVEIILELAPRRLRRELDVLDGRGGIWGDDAAAARVHLGERLAPVTLRNLRPRTSPDRIVVVVADHDRIVGAGPVREMAEAWGAEMWPYGLGHVTLIAARGLTGRIHARLQQDLAPTPAAASVAATGA